MSAFDQPRHPRTPAGVSAGGQFTIKARTEPGVVLFANAPDDHAPLERPMTAQEARQAAVDGYVSAVLAVDLDALVAEVRDGSHRGVDYDEHDWFVSQTVEGAVPYDSSYEVVGARSDGMVLVQVRTGVEGFPGHEGDDTERVCAACGESFDRREGFDGDYCSSLCAESEGADTATEPGYDELEYASFLRDEAAGKAAEQFRR